MTRKELKALRAAYLEISKAMDFPMTSGNDGPKALIYCRTLSPIMDAVSTLIRDET